MVTGGAGEINNKKANLNARHRKKIIYISVCRWFSSADIGKMFTVDRTIDGAKYRSVRNSLFSCKIIRSRVAVHLPAGK